MKGFIPHSYPAGEPTPWEYLKAAAGQAIDLGDALSLTDGELTLCTGAAAPEFIAMCDLASAAAAKTIPVIRVDSGVIFQTLLSETFTDDPVVGAKHTISASSDSITATTTGGVAEIVRAGGKTLGDAVLVKF